MFERQWALALLDRVLARLRDEFARKAQQRQFERLKPFLSGDSERVSYVQLATDLNMNEGAARVAVHRLRRRYGAVLREEISQLVADPGDAREIDDEIRYLVGVLA